MAIDPIEGIYRHYKGNLYRVLCVAKHSETLGEMVVYQDAIDEAKVWVRPLSMWSEEVDIGGEKVPRFQFVSSDVDALDETPLSSS